MVLVVFSKINSQESQAKKKKKKNHKVKAVMEEESASYERVYLYIQPNSLCKDSAEYTLSGLPWLWAKNYTHLKSPYGWQS